MDIAYHDASNIFTFSTPSWPPLFTDLSVNFLLLTIAITGTLGNPKPFLK